MADTNTIEITTERPVQEITLHIVDSGDINFSVYTDTPSAYTTINDALMRLSTINAQYRSIVLAEGMTNEDRGKKYFEFLGEQAQICLDALRKVVGEEEWKKLEPVAQYLPINTLVEVLKACASAVSRAAVNRLKEGRV